MIRGQMAAIRREMRQERDRRRWVWQEVGVAREEGAKPFRLLPHPLQGSAGPAPSRAGGGTPGH